MLTNISKYVDIIKRIEELRKEDKSYSKIATIISKEFNASISKATVIRWYKRITNPLNKMNVGDLESSKELAYVIGAYLGDGTIKLNKKDYKYTFELLK